MNPNKTRIMGVYNKCFISYKGTDSILIRTKEDNKHCTLPTLLFFHLNRTIPNPTLLYSTLTWRIRTKYSFLFYSSSYKIPKAEGTMSAAPIPWSALQLLKQ
jgi:hypothetical protein